MLILCYGMQKSGSTLAFELVRGMLRNAGFEQENFINDECDPEDLKSSAPGIRNFANKLKRKKIKSMMSFIGPDRKIAVKTHSGLPAGLYNWLEEQQASGDLQVIASFRDPREICLSLMDASRKARRRNLNAFVRLGDLKSAEMNVLRRIQDFGKWASLNGALRLNYDMVAFSPDQALDRLEDTLKIVCDREVVKNYAFTEAPTQKNKATQHRYRDELNEEQNAAMLDAFGDFIERVCERDDPTWFDECRSRVLRDAAQNNKGALR